VFGGLPRRLLSNIRLLLARRWNQKSNSSFTTYRRSFARITLPERPKACRMAYCQMNRPLSGVQSVMSNVTTTHVVVTRFWKWGHESCFKSSSADVTD